MDQDKDAQKGSPEGDDELENLSSDEKAAFEKIMAEIATATGGATKGGADDAARKSKAGSSAKPSSTVPLTAIKEAPPADNAQANLDQIMSQIASQKEGKNPGVPGTADKKVSGDPPEDLSKDQQAALDQIMAEIGSKRKAEITPAPSPETAYKADEQLSKDQQAALDSIMAEIGSKRKAEKIPAVQSETADKKDEALNADQQAALDSIMAEIGAKRKTENDADIAKESVPAQDDPQADIEKIMAEIEAKKGRDAAVSEPSVEAPTEDKSISPKKAGENLTMEEFDDELSNLLSSAQAAPVTKTAVKTKAAEMPKPATVEPATAVDTGKIADSAKANSHKPSENGGQAKKEYPILKEVSVDPKSKPKKNKATRSGRNEKGAGQSRKTATAAALIIGILAICIGGYWAYRHQWAGPSVPVTVAPDSVPTGEQVKPVAVNASPENAVVSQPVAVAPAGTPESVVADAPVKPALNAPMETPAMMLSAANNELASARKQIQTKISDIQQLKSYYGRGIEEETQKIEDALQSGRIPSFDAALADKKIELGIRAIQRRQTYMAKLDTPLAQLGGMSEQLLYMERRARIYDVLLSGITGLPIEGFKKEVDETIGQYLAFNTQISIDRVELQPPTLETIWAQIESGLKQKANLLAQRAPLNQAISAEICKGNYERKYLLSALSAETARCLVKWNGKDLYLNGLTELTPDVADILAQWPGEWISLNGLRQLHTDSAKHLSRWAGKRLSLNGLSELSPEATAHLSRWKGSQLEMVGLQSIGSWENYGTRLYLSEKLRRQLEAQ